MKILLLSHVPPSSSFTAGLVLERMCKLIPRENLACVNVMDINLTPKDISNDLIDVPYLLLTQPREFGWKYTRFQKIGKVLVLFLNLLIKYFKVPKITAKVKKFAIDNKVTHLWVLMETVNTLRIAKELHHSLGLVLLPQCTDLISWYLREKNVDRLTYRESLGNFNYLISNAARVAVPSEQMGQRFMKKFASDTIIITNSYAALTKRKIIQKFQKMGEFRIAFAGQVYAKDAWMSLVSSLAEVKWVIGGRRVRIFYLGRIFPEVPQLLDLNITYLGFRPQDEVVEILSNMDLLYCPYPFDKSKEDVYKYSFPSKLPGYFATSTPVLVHASEDSSISVYAKNTGSALICNSLETADILKKLTEFVDLEDEDIKLLLKRSEDCLLKDFGEETFRSVTKNFLGL